MEDKIECIESKKVKYHCREDLAWSLSIPMEEIVNKGDFMTGGKLNISI